MSRNGAGFFPNCGRSRGTPMVSARGLEEGGASARTTGGRKGMTERVLGPTGGRRRKRLAVFVPFFALAALILAIGASAGPVSTAAGFQGDDGNLTDDGAGIDWNSFDPVQWSGGTA